MCEIAKNCKEIEECVHKYDMYMYIFDELHKRGRSICRRANFTAIQFSSAAYDKSVRKSSR